MSFHKHPRNDVVTPAGQFKPDVTLADYIARKTKEPMMFDEWWEQQGFHLDPNCLEYYHEFELCWKAAQENM